MPVQVPLPITGALEYFGIAFETTALGYGSPQQPSIFYRPASNTLRATPVTEAMQGPSGQFARFKYGAPPEIPRHLRLPSDRSGQVVLELDYDDVGWLLTNLITQPVFNSFQTGGGQHIWKVGPQSPALGPPSMTCTRNSGMPDKDYRIGGCMINQAVFRGQGGQLVTITADIVGATGGEPAGNRGGVYNAPAPTSFSTAPFIEFFHSDISVSTGLNIGGLVPYSGTGADVGEWTFTYNNNYDISPSAGGGTLGIRQPTWQTAPSITLEWTQRWTTAKEFDLMHPLTEAGRYRYVRLEMVHPTEIAGTGGTGTRLTLRFDMPAALFLGDPPVYDGGTGFITQNVRVEASGGGTEITLLGVVLNAVLLNDTATPGYVITA